MAQFNTRIGLKVDTLTNWTSSKIQLLNGEIAIATVSKTASGADLTDPVIMIKIGDGESTFSELPWSFYAKAADVYTWAKAKEVVLDGQTLKFKTDDAVIKSVDLSTFVTEDELTAALAGIENTDTTYTFASGTTQGAFSVTPKGGSAQSVAIYGLGTAAYKAESAFDAAGAANTALINAKAYTDTEITELEGVVSGKQATLSTTQLAAVNSGIDATKVAKYENFFSEAGAEGVIDTLTEIVAYIEQDEQGAINLAADVAANAANITKIVDGTTTVAKASTATNATQLGGTAASNYLKKTEATGYGDILTKTSAATLYQAKGSYATADQGAKADTAIQSIKILGETLTDGSEVTVAEAKTALGLKSAAYTESSAYATAAQGTKADNAVPSTRTVNGKALSTDITLSASDVGAATTANITSAINALDSSVAATAMANGQYSVLTGVTQTNGKLTAKTEVKLAKIATTGSTDDLIQGEILIFNCGTASTVI